MDIQLLSTKLNNLQNNGSSIKAPFIIISLSTISEADVSLFFNNLICFFSSCMVDGLLNFSYFTIVC